MEFCHEPSAFKSLCQPSLNAFETYSTNNFHLPIIHPALLSNSHLLHLSSYNPTSFEHSESLFENNNNNSEKAESSCSSRDSNHDSSSSPTSTGRSSSAGNRDNVIVRNEVKRKKFQDQIKDEAYWERRRKNNDAAKRSRDQRRQKEDEMATRAASLENENVRLRNELEKLRAETDRLRTLILGPSTSINIPMPNADRQLTPIFTGSHPSHSVITTSQLFAPLTPVQIPSNSPPLIRNSVLVSNPTKT